MKYSLGDKVFWNETGETHHVGVVTRIDRKLKMVVVTWEDDIEVGYPDNEPRLNHIYQTAPFYIRHDRILDDYYVYSRIHGCEVAGPYTNKGNALRSAAVHIVNALDIDIRVEET